MHKCTGNKEARYFKTRQNPAKNIGRSKYDASGRKVAFDDGGRKD